MVDWSKLPDLGTVALLAAAFATVARRSQTPAYGLWLTGWIIIAVHFAALFFAPLPGMVGTVATFLALASLAWAGILFMWATVPQLKEPFTRRTLITALCTISGYIAVVVFAGDTEWLVTLFALLIGAAPVAIAISYARDIRQPLRYARVVICLALSVILLATENLPHDGHELALNAIFFTVYLSCALHFFFVFRRLGAAVFVTTSGFLAWAFVFVFAPAFRTNLPAFQLDSEVWNLPKYIVAFGMILILLQQQIEHTRHLALHDELTGLPNRRLFQDRLSSSLNRARRSGSRTALLLVDLDRFKQVNDSVGHHVGDEVLKKVAQILLARIRRCDTVARTGGDEFSIILEEPITRADAERVSHSLIQLLHQSLAFEGHTIRIGASIGLALYPEDAPNPETLRVEADLSMYAHKNITRGTDIDSPLSPQSSPGSTKIESRNTA